MESYDEATVLSFAEWCERNAAIFNSPAYNRAKGRIRFCWVNLNVIRNPSGYTTKELFKIYLKELTDGKVEE